MTFHFKKLKNNGGNIHGPDQILIAVVHRGILGSI